MIVAPQHRRQGLLDHALCANLVAFFEAAARVDREVPQEDRPTGRPGVGSADRR